MKSFGDIRLIRAFKNRQEPECVHVLADSYWKVLLIVCTLSSIAAIAYDVWQFSDVDRVISQQLPKSTSMTKLPFDPKQLQTIIDGFAQRQMTYKLYSTQAFTIADPSGIPAKPTR